jgi:hypothetical protein
MNSTESGSKIYVYNDEQIKELQNHHRSCVMMLEKKKEKLYTSTKNPDKREEKEKEKKIIAKILIASFGHQAE